MTEKKINQEIRLKKKQSKTKEIDNYFIKEIV